MLSVCCLLPPPAHRALLKSQQAFNPTPICCDIQMQVLGQIGVCFLPINELHPGLESQVIGRKPIPICPAACIWMSGQIGVLIQGFPNQLSIMLCIRVTEGGGQRKEARQPSEQIQALHDILIAS